MTNLCDQTIFKLITLRTINFIKLSVKFNILFFIRMSGILLFYQNIISSSIISFIFLLVFQTAAQIFITPYTPFATSYSESNFHLAYWHIHIIKENVTKVCICVCVCGLSKSRPLPLTYSNILGQHKRIKLWYHVKHCSQCIFF